MYLRLRGREGQTPRPTLADVTYLKTISSILHCSDGMAPATASGYKTCLRADPPTDLTDHQWSVVAGSGTGQAA